MDKTALPQTMTQPRSHCLIAGYPDQQPSLCNQCYSSTRQCRTRTFKSLDAQKAFDSSVVLSPDSVHVVLEPGQCYCEVYIMLMATGR